MSWTSRTWRLAWRSAAAVWWAVTGVVVVVCVGAGGLLLGPGALALVCPVVAVSAVISVHHVCESTGRRRPRLSLVAAAAAAGAVALCGSGALVGMAGPALLAVLAALGWGLRVWRQRLLEAAVRREVDGPASQQRHPAGGSQVAGPVRAGREDDDVARLCRSWRSTYEALGRCTDPTRRAALVAVRQECLEEIERRAPEGFRRWMDSAPGPQDDPLRYLAPSDGQT